MQSKTVLSLVLAFGVAFTMLAGAGVGALFGETPADEETAQTVGDIADEADVDEDSEGDGLGADVAGDNEPTLVGIAISGGQFVVQLVVALALLPNTLMGLNFPWWFSIPIGNVARIIGFIGLVQFIGRTELI